MNHASPPARAASIAASPRVRIIASMRNFIVVGATMLLAACGSAQPQESAEPPSVDSITAQSQGTPLADAGEPSPADAGPPSDAGPIAPVACDPGTGPACAWFTNGALIGNTVTFDVSKSAPSDMWAGQGPAHPERQVRFNDGATTVIGTDDPNFQMDILVCGGRKHSSYNEEVVRLQFTTQSDGTISCKPICQPCDGTQ